ncbi:MAG: cysteine desulfurase [Gemmatimonadetes bacterium]|nr:cysteine desulfurase [Gemmatimonadota bacterium]
MTPTPIYLDHAATTPLRPEAREAMAPYLADKFGNPSSLHRWGRTARAALESARERIGGALGVSPAEIYFVRGGTEANNLAILGRARAAELTGRRPLVACSAIEHKSVLGAANEVQARGGEFARIPVGPDGRVDPASLDDVLTPEPAVVSVMWVNNEIGTVQDVPALAARCRATGVPFHTDAVQALGKVPVRLDEVPADLASFTGHKLYGPKGLGILFVRKGVTVHPLVHGGGQERGLRAGTEDVASAVGLAEAIILAATEQEAEAARLRALTQRLAAGLAARISGLVFFGSRTSRAPHILNVGIPGVDLEALLVSMDLEGLAVSSGSACSSGAVEPSHVLRAILGEAAAVPASLRFSVGRATRDEDIDRAVEATARIVERLRAFAEIAV